MVPGLRVKTVDVVEGLGVTNCWKGKPLDLKWALWLRRTAISWGWFPLWLGLLVQSLGESQWWLSWADTLNESQSWLPFHISWHGSTHVSTLSTDALINVNIYVLLLTPSVVMAEVNHWNQFHCAILIWEDKHFRQSTAIPPELRKSVHISPVTTTRSL